MRKQLVKLRATAVGRYLNIPRRAVLAFPVASKPLRQMIPWLITSKEETNYTYRLKPLNMRYLACAVALATRSNAKTALAYMNELLEDTELAHHILSHRDGPERAYSDRRADYGRRLGWYAVARIMKPELVVETGVDKGLGSVVLCAALLRNGSGRYIGTDINPRAGGLLTGRYSTCGEIRYGDSVETLKSLSGIDLFVNDSDHSAEYERLEYETIAQKLTDRAILLGDNSHETSVLLDFSEENGRHFLFWRERPLSHWYPGGGIGFSFPS